jgi:hypothetical protein
LRLPAPGLNRHHIEGYASRDFVIVSAAGTGAMTETRKLAQLCYSTRFLRFSRDAIAATRCICRRGPRRTGCSADQGACAVRGTARACFCATRFAVRTARSIVGLSSRTGASRAGAWSTPGAIPRRNQRQPAAAWSRAIEVFDDAGQSAQIALFPEDRRRFSIVTWFRSA